MEKKVSAGHLKIGMYVSRLDRPWVETPFMFQGFLLRDADEITSLAEHCAYVYIDAEKGVDSDHFYMNHDEEKIIENDLVQLLARRGDKPVYIDTTPVEQEMLAAREIHRDARKTITALMEDVHYERKIDIAALKRVINAMIASILRNPDAFTWMTKHKDKKSYPFVHALDASALAVIFGRHLGLSAKDLEYLAIGTLLCDVGKMKLSVILLAKPGRYTDAEFVAVREHVMHGVELIKSIPGLREDTAEIVMNHHERHNGMGYPRGLAGKNIPLYARIAGLADVYDAITSDRVHAKAISEHEAIRKLYEWRDVDFQKELVEQFIQCLGVYPTGSLIELSSGEVCIVLSQNRYRRLRPKVLAILDPDKVAYTNPITLDLVNHELDANGHPLEIKNSLEPGTFGIDPRNYLL